ncbi:Hypothetical protein POVR1_LOCUS94 [uncultured virus]|nr:Hypothetical protein POVR1_LOCUS94 [uncultured virus]
MDITNDTWMILFLKIPYYDLLNHRSTCHKFYSLTDSAFWSLRYFQDFGSDENLNSSSMTHEKKYFERFMRIDTYNFKGEDYVNRYLELITFTEIHSGEPPKLYIQGFEEVSDGYESDCLYLKIGVIAKSRTAGYGLLVLLNALKLSRLNSITYMIDITLQDDNEKSFLLTDVLKTTICSESGFGHAFELTEPIKQKIWHRDTISGKRVNFEVTNELYLIDLYTFPRIVDEVYSNLDFTCLDDYFDDH